MDNAKFWWSSNAIPPVPPVDVIGQSLRFRGSSGGDLYLDNMAQPATWTMNFWLKIGYTPDDLSGDYLFSWHYGSTKYNIASIGRTGGSSSVITLPPRWCNNQGGWQNFNDTTVFRDTAAWYNFHYTMVNGTVTLTVNNQLIGTATGNQGGTASNFTIGGQDTNSTAELYYSNYYFIDGQSLLPTAFGRYNDDGVWVPREVDFTPAEMRNSDFLTAEGGFMADTAVGGGAHYAFNGNLEQRATTNDGNSVVTFAPVPAIDFTDGVEVMVRSNSIASLNGAANVNTNAGESGVWTELATGAGSINTITAQARNGSTTAVYGFRINPGTATEQILTNPFIWSADLRSATTATGPNNGNGLTPNDMFQAAIQTAASVNNEADWLVWEPTGGIDNVTTLDLALPGLNMTVEVNGTAVITNTPGTGDWQTITLPGDFSGTINTLSFFGAGGANRCLGVRINGEVYIDGTNPSYGANGFHLQFADPDDLGHDSSGNGNDFTATGFNTDPVGIFSNFLFSSTTPLNINSTDQNIGLSANSQRHNGFDGATNYWPITQSGADNWYIFRPDTPLTNVTSIQFTAPTNAFTININGTNTGQTVTPTSSTTVTDITLPGGFDGTLNSLAYNNTTSSSGQSGFSQLLIGQNGNAARVLVDNTNPDYDLMQDSPTQNYPTFNPLWPETQQTLFAANLAINTGQITGGQANIRFPVGMKGKYYFEAFSYNTPDNTPPALVLTNQLDAAIVPNEGVVDQADYSVITHLKYSNFSDSSGTAYTANSNLPKVLAFAIDFDNQEVRFYSNGELINTDTTVDFNTELAINVQQPTNGYDTYQPSINFGQHPFYYTPPAGFEALQTQNLPAATIANGRDHFQAITGPGTGVAAGTFPNQLNGGWARFLTAPGGFVASPNDQSAAFSDADVSSIAADPNVILTFEPDTPIAFTTHFRFASNHSAESPGEFSFNGGPWTAINHDFSGHTRADYATNGQTIATGPGQLESFRIRRLENADQPAIFWMQIDDDIMVDSGILRVAQQIFPNGLWWIKSRVSDGNTNQHQLGTSLTNNNEFITTPASPLSMIERAYISPAGNSVAWCWNAPDAFTPTGSNGLTNLSGTRNVDAGFSIVLASAQGLANATYTHGLNETPEFILAKCRDQAHPWYVYHQDLTDAPNTQYYLALNSDKEERDSSALTFNLTTPGSVILGVNNSINSNNEDYVYYNWHSVPGYSAFGSYTANGDDDGVFVYTGFSVAWLMCKRVGSSGDWVILDTTRGPVNPNNLWLEANSTSEETAPAIGVVDLLSNGFKHRSASAQLNNSGDYIYCAFASNPFQAPVTAR